MFDSLVNTLTKYNFYGNSGWQYFVAICIFIGLSVALYIFRRIILSYLLKWSKRTVNKFDDILIEVLNSIGPFTYPVLAFYISLYYLDLPSSFTKVFSVFFVFILALESIKAFSSIFDVYVKLHLSKIEKESEKRGTKSVMQIIKIIIKVILWIVVLLMILSNLGVNVTSVVASLGIGGIAIALAIQNVLSDLLSSFSIYIDKPFVVGDFIAIGTDKGTVEKIGLKTTRIRSLAGEELVISNKELTSARVNNFKKLEKRRDAVVFGVEYGTDIEKLRAIPKIVEDIVVPIEKAEFSRCKLKMLADFSINFELVYVVNSSDIELFIDIKQDILLQMVEEFQKQGIAFAYPTQEVIIRK